MANEKRLIDANLLEPIIEAEIIDSRTYILNSMLSAVLDLVRNFPTVDAVEVVRCKDCAYWWDRGCGKGTCDRETEEMGLSRLYLESDFCSYGERREGE